MKVTGSLRQAGRARIVDEYPVHLSLSLFVDEVLITESVSHPENLLVSNSRMAEVECSTAVIETWPLCLCGLTTKGLISGCPRCTDRSVLEGPGIERRGIELSA